MTIIAACCYVIKDKLAGKSRCSRSKESKIYTKMANSKRFSFQFKTSATTSKAARNSGTIEIHSDDETLPDLVLDATPRKNVDTQQQNQVGNLSLDVSEFLGRQTVGQTLRQSDTMQSAKCLGIKTSQKRKSRLPISVKGQKKKRVQEPLNYSPEVIDISEDDPHPAPPEETKEVIVIDLEQLDETTDTFEGERLSDLARNVNGDLQDVTTGNLPHKLYVRSVNVSVVNMKPVNESRSIT